MNVLIACEASQTVAEAFRKFGHNAFSCDIEPEYGGHPEWHIRDDVTHIIDGRCIFETETGEAYGIPDKWDLIIAHPPCTYLTVTANRWFNEEKYGDSARERKKLREAAASFFLQLINADCDHIAVENPVGWMNTHYRKPDQIVQPYMFGDAAEKRTCFWLKGLPILEPTDVVAPPPRQQLRSGKSMPVWYSNASGDRAKVRSKTFPGIAAAMAEQWGTFVQKGEAK